MPEITEVEAARRAVEENCLGKKIKRAIIANDSKVIEGVSSSEFESAVVGKTIVSAHRKGKNLWLQLDSPPFPTFQFGMAGAIYIKGVAVAKYKRSAVKDNDEWPSKYSKFFVELDDGLELSFTDKRRFAKVRLLKDPTSVPPISELGPDALFEPMAVDEFTVSLSKKKIGIKALLLDQSYISGIGNWIADEVLYQARIHPLQVSSSLSKENCATLHKCIKEVIQYAVEVDDDSSRFPNDWLFHFRWGKKSGKINGKKIDFINAGGRTSAYVPELQKLSGTSASKAAGKPRKQTSKRKGGKAKDNDEDEEGTGDEPTTEEEETTKITKSRKGGNPKGNGKKPPIKRKTTENDDDDDNCGGKDDASSEKDDEAPKEKARKVKNRTSNKQVNVAKASKQAASSQNGKKPKKAK
ncbi:Formamidopyrimidine-DNA glycosylase [Hibiscus syriacus]|uniref:Formamidopyrimidine-DNA glycosylase n=1 Tax=Hibiscus syriacus TaxID=106335 RepID=A0A6A3AMI7_HIBSY|nr:formamidopyrimidine-DNA glycosylase-like isoform X2 [Hibiscus syriacus]KAE8705083.1 Formamidopyrimidine-DNA glycosylase [Hibiscus syriacus]